MYSYFKKNIVTKMKKKVLNYLQKVNVLSFKKGKKTFYSVFEFLNFKLKYYT